MLKYTLSPFNASHTSCPYTPRPEDKTISWEPVWEEVGKESIAELLDEEEQEDDHTGSRDQDQDQAPKTV